MISDNYKKILTDIHDTSPFGKRSKVPKYLAEFIEQVKPTSILDFGCGKGRLVHRLREDYPDMSITGYDPGNREFDESLDGRLVDLLISTDVLEHVEPEHINQTLEYLSHRSRYIYHLIALSPAKLILPDGRNAHLIQESPEWWRNKFLNLNYKIIKEDYMEFYKTPKGTKKPMLVKKYFIMAEKQ
jgi:2-polyprenyl-3-methyl-5-hydroxy-6-metoxy-1,4-benzoquinol methylase